MCHFSEASTFNISGDETGASISLARDGILDREKLSSLTLVIMVRILFYILVTGTSLAKSIKMIQGTKLNYWEAPHLLKFNEFVSIVNNTKISVAQ